MSYLLLRLFVCLIRGVHLHSENARLHSENARLHSENARLHSENARLHSENARLHSVDGKATVNKQQQNTTLFQF